LIDAFETCVIRCVPPDNKPTPTEQRQCRPFLNRELELLPNIKVILALGHLAFNNILDVLDTRLFREHEEGPKPSLKFKFKHGAMYEFGHGMPILYASYHPSPRNTRTGRLTIDLFDNVLKEIRRHLGEIPKF
jgi:uracil-DNA glycosylase family 4